MIHEVKRTKMLKKNYIEHIIDVPSKNFVIMDPCYLDTQDLRLELMDKLSQFKSNKKTKHLCVSYPFDNEGLAVILSSDTENIKAIVHEIDEGEFGQNISQVTLKHKEGNHPVEYVIVGEVGVDSGQIIFYDADRLVLDWKTEEASNIPTHVIVRTFLTNEKLINDFVNEFKDVKIKEELETKSISKKHTLEEEKNIIKINYVKIHFLIDDKDVNKVKKMLEMYQDVFTEVRFIKETSYIKACKTHNTSISLNKDLMVFGLKISSGYGDGLYEVIQSFDINNELIETSIVVVGGGDAAVEEGIYLTRFAKKVTIIHRREALRAQKIIQERAFQNEKIEFVWNHTVEEVLGEGGVVSGVKIKDVQNGEETVFPCNGVFIYVGMDWAASRIYCRNILRFR